MVAFEKKYVFLHFKRKKQNMSCILHIETSTDVCSVALSQDGACIFKEIDNEGPNHAVKLGMFVDSAKGICYARDLKLISVPTLELLCVPILLTHDEMEDNALLCPMIDARRMEVYSAIYDRSLKQVREVGADIIDEHSYQEYLDRGPVWFFGNGAEKCKEVINHPNAHFIPNIKPDAEWMMPLAEKRMACEQFEDTAYYVPFYLKDFVAKMPTKLV